MNEKLLDIMRPMPPFRPELRQANRDERKSQTRRVMDPQPFPYDVGQPTRDMCWKNYIYPGEKFGMRVVRHCKYGKAGDVTYMREPLVRVGGYAFYKDDNKPAVSLITGEMVKWRWKNDVLTSIFMPKEAARSIYKYESIRAERVQEISRFDAKAEGVSQFWRWDAERNSIHPEHFQRGLLNPYIANFSVLWDEINAERGFGWDVNPWVWVLEYKPVKVNDAS